MSGLDDSCTRTSTKSLQGRRITDPLASKVFSFHEGDPSGLVDRVSVSELSQTSFFSVIKSTGVRFTHLRDSCLPLLPSLMLDLSLRVRFTSQEHSVNMAVLKLLKSFGEVKIVSLSSSKGLNDWRLRVPPSYFAKGVEEPGHTLQFQGIQISLEFEEELLSECSYDLLKLRDLQETTLHEGPNALVLQGNLKLLESQPQQETNYLAKPVQGPLHSSGTTQPESQTTESQSCLRKPLRLQASVFTVNLSQSNSASDDEPPQTELQAPLRPKIASMSNQQEIAKTNINDLKRRVQIHAKTLEGCPIFKNIQNRIACKVSPDMEEAERLLIEAKIMRSKIKRMKRKQKSKRKDKLQGAEEHVVSGNLSDEDQVQTRSYYGMESDPQPKAEVGPLSGHPDWMPLHTGNLGMLRGYPVGFGGLTIQEDSY